MSTPHAILAVKVIPNASRDEIIGWLGDALKIKLQAPPLEGRANAALCAFLANTLDLPKSAVTMLSGKTSRLKKVRLAGLTPARLQTRLDPFVTQ
ncbi:MAG TPA: DUF167 domain-containing protein [Opitutaceae bacterium]|nr:DUF167 domain-containing protein [Opitutaceae bacterium]HRJ47550.1 DUF167 domain-containing protein [Opitutaceae bacterium]